MSFKKVLSFFLFASLLFTVFVSAQSRAGTPQVNLKAKQVKLELARADIAVTDIFVDKKCRLWVRYKNMGNVKIDMVLRERTIVNGTVVEDAKFRQPMAPGTEFSHGVQADPGYIVSGVVNVKTIVDVDNDLKEVNERNNSLTKTVRCGSVEKPDLGMYGFLKIGESKKLVKWNETVILNPQDAFLISPQGNPAFNIYYSEKNYNDGGASGYKNKIFFHGNVVSIQSNRTIGPKGSKNDIHTQAYLPPKDGWLTIKIDADNNVSESREDNNSFRVMVRFRGFKK